MEDGGLALQITKKRESAQSKRKTRYINGPLDTNINKLISRPYFILSGVNFRLPEGSFNDPDGYFIAKAPFIRPSQAPKQITN